MTSKTTKTMPKTENNTKAKQNKEELTEEKKETKDKRNNATKEAKLSFNVNKFRDFIVNQCKILGKKVPKLSYTHQALTASCEAMTFYILKETTSHISKGKEGLYNLSSSSLIGCMQMNNELKDLFMSVMLKYDQNLNYTKQYCVSYEEMTEYIDKNFSNNIKLNEQGYNFLCYILINFASMMVSTAYLIMTGMSNKLPKNNEELSQVMSSRHLYTALTIVCRYTNAILADITRKTEEAVVNSGGTVRYTGKNKKEKTEKNDDENEIEENDGNTEVENDGDTEIENNSEEEEPKKQTKKQTKETKETKKK
jgi:hypothetical protein